ncbi:MAG: 50S ribosomal protein L22 [Kiritimatiellia bacterium]
MEVKAITRNVRISVRKSRPLIRQIQGQKLADALNIAEFSTCKAAIFIAQTLRSAGANAKNNNNLDPETLTVKKAVCDEGARQRRFWCGARGSAKPIQKKLSHITVVLTNE